MKTLIDLLSDSVSQILFLPFFKITAVIVKTFRSLLIGVALGLAEGLTWHWQRLEARDNKRFFKKLIASLI